MKPLTILTFCLLSLVLIRCNSGSSTSSTVSNGNETVTISDNDDTYTLDASFKEGKSTDVFRRVNEALKPNSLFSSDDRVDDRASLSGGGILHIKARRGELTLTFDKKSHSEEAYRRVKALGEAVKKVCDVR